MGRPKKGKTEVLYRRLPPELMARVDGLLAAEIRRRHEGTMRAIGEWFLREYGVCLGGGGSAGALVDGPDCVGLGEKTRDEMDVGRVRELEMEVERLRRRVKELEEMYG